MRSGAAWRGGRQRGVGLYVNMWNMNKGGWQVFGLDSHPCYWGTHWGYCWNTLYEPCCDVRTRVVTGKPGPFRSYSVETG